MTERLETKTRNFKVIGVTKERLTEKETYMLQLQYDGGSDLGGRIIFGVSGAPRFVTGTIVTADIYRTHSPMGIPIWLVDSKTIYENK